MLTKKILSEALSSGVRKYDPVLQVPRKFVQKEPHVFYNFTNTKVYHHMLITDKEPIPKMHSMMIPGYLRVKQWQRDLMVNDGYRLYEKWPLQRSIYRVTWCATIAVFICTQMELMMHIIARM